MSEIIKLYKNAGIEKQKYFVMQDENYKDVFEIKYPPFTAEKQLELIKWLALTRSVTINKFIDGWTIEGLVRNNKQYANFENAISGYINSIYPFLDERQRTEIKEILE